MRAGDTIREAVTTPAGGGGEQDRQCCNRVELKEGQQLPRSSRTLPSSAYSLTTKVCALLSGLLHKTQRFLLCPEIKRYPIECVAVEMKDEAIGKWDVFLEGPRGTPFEGGASACGL